MLTITVTVSEAVGKSLSRAIPASPLGTNTNWSTPYMFRLARTFLKPSLPQHGRVFGNRTFFIQRFPYHSLFINPPRTEVPNLTLAEVINIFATEIGQAKEYSKEGIKKTEERRKALMELIPQPEDVLPPRKMEESYVSAIVPLKNNRDIRERYVTVRGHVRIGRLLEDLDVFAVYCCFKHILNPRSVGKHNPYSVVTALVDSIHITSDVLKSDEDIRLSGHVSYTGRSSMEVCIIVDQLDDNGVYQKAFDAVFLMVARDPMNTGSARVNSLEATTPEEEEYMKKGKERQRIRKQQEEDHIMKKPPNPEESELIHRNFLQKLALTPESPGYVAKRPMKDTVFKSVVVCHPQNRNRYNKIFGGFIMRQAFELAFANTLIHAGVRPKLIHIDDIKFQRPVEIGDILSFRSHIGYVEGNFIHTVVRASIINPSTGESSESNTFHFDFHASDKQNTRPIREIEFETYAETINFLNSRRHFKKMMEEFGHNFKGWN